MRLFRSTAVITILALAGAVACTDNDPAKPATWIRQLDNRDPDKVADAARELRKLKAKEGVEPLVGLLKHDSIKVREEAANALMAIGDKSAVPGLIAAVDLSSTTKGMGRVNTRIAEALGSLGDKSAVPALIKLTEHFDDYARIAAVDSLARLADERAIPRLRRLADHSNTSLPLAKRSIIALGNMQAEEAIPTLLRGLVMERSGGSFFMESAYALFQIGQPAIPALVAVLSGEDKDYVQWAQENRRQPAGYLSKAAIVLSDIGDRSAIPHLVKLMNWKDPTGNDFWEMIVHGAAADALARLRATEGAAPIASRLDIQEANIREKYAVALALIGDQRYIPHLEKAARQGSWTARQAALTGVGMLSDGRSKSLFDAVAKQETGEAAFKDCMSTPGNPNESRPLKEARCEKQKTDRPKFVEQERARLLAGDACKSDASCWVSKLGDEVAKVRERAAFELGKLQEVGAIDALVKACKDDDRHVRRAAYIALDWFTSNPEAKSALKSHAETLSTQVEEERGKAHWIVVNEDLRRVVWKVSRL